jgi:hypothetical protein
MKRICAASLLLPFLIAACSGEAPQPERPAGKQAAAPAPAAKARLVEEKNDLLEFTYGWPAEAAAIPRLAAQLEADMGKQRAEAADSARGDKAAREGEPEFNGHFFSKSWKTYGNGRRLLSLGVSVETFTGGAHGNQTFDALLWDRQADAPVALGALFTDPARAAELIGRAFCQRLDRQRGERRGEEPPLSGDGFLVECPPIAEQVIVPLDRDDRVFEGLLVLVPPYAAGPYAEGAYEVEVELTDEMRRLIKPEYRGDF